MFKEYQDMSVPGVGKIDLSHGTVCLRDVSSCHTTALTPGGSVLL